jgi:hypothetical protein
MLTDQLSSAALGVLLHAAELENAHLQWLQGAARSLALVSTDLDEPVDQLRTGMALQRVLLTALAHNVRTICRKQTLIDLGEAPTANEHRSQAS